MVHNSYFRKMCWSYLVRAQRTVLVMRRKGVNTYLEIWKEMNELGVHLRSS